MNNTHFERLLAKLEVVVHRMDRQNTRLTQSQVDQLSSSLADTVIRVSEHVETVVSNTDIIKDTPRQIRTKQPGHLSSFTGVFKPMDPQVIDIDLERQASVSRLPMFILPVIPFSLPTFNNEPLPPVIPPGILRPTPPSPEPSLKPIQKPVTKPASVKPKQVPVPEPVKPKQVPVPEPVKPKQVPDPVPVKPKQVPDPVPVKPKQVPVKPIPNIVPTIVPKTKPTPKPKLSIKTFPQIFDYKYDAAKSDNLQSQNRVKLSRAIDNSLIKSSKLAATHVDQYNINRSKPHVAPGTQKNNRAPMRMSSYAKLNTTSGGLVSSVPFIAMSSIIEHVRHDQLVDETKQLVSMTDNFNEFFAEQMKKPGMVTESEILREQLKSTDMNKPGSIKSPITVQQAIDRIVSKKRQDLLDKYYNEIWIPDRDKRYMQTLLMDRSRSLTDDIYLDQLIEKYPAHYQKHQHIHVPREGAIDGVLPVPEDTQAMYHQVMEEIDQLASTKTTINNNSNTVAPYHVTDDQDILFEITTIT